MKFVLISVILLESFAVALSLKCYRCEKCGSSDGNATTCSSDKNKCYKVLIKKDDKVKIERSCGTQSLCDKGVALCKEGKDKDVVDDCVMSCCDTDLCNSGAILSNSVAAPNFSVLLVSLCSLFAVFPFFK